MICVELRRLTPTVLGIGWQLSASTPAAIGSGIGVERENGGSDNGVESCEIIVGMFMSGLS